MSDQRRSMTAFGQGQAIVDFVKDESKNSPQGVGIAKKAKQRKSKGGTFPSPSERRKNRNAITVTIRSVNARYLDVRFQMPRIYQQFESEVKKRIAKLVSRGTVDVYIDRPASSDRLDSSIKFDHRMAKEVQNGLNALAADLGLASPTRLEEVLSIVPLARTEDFDVVSKEEKEGLFRAIDEALESHQRQAVKEGQALIKDIKKHLNELKNHVKGAYTLRKKANEHLEERLKKRLQALLGEDRGLEPERLAQEALILRDRADINEELARLKEHIRAFEEALAGAGPIGKKLDFYCQELVREINTVGSKSQVTELTSLVVESKTCIERIREQVQNIE